MTEERAFLYSRVLEKMHLRGIVIDAGAVDGVVQDATVIVHALADEVFDPDTGESLGMLEHTKGHGYVRHVQGGIAEAHLTHVFDDVNVGDSVKVAIRVKKEVKTCTKRTARSLG